MPLRPPARPTLARALRGLVALLALAIVAPLAAASAPGAAAHFTRSLAAPTVALVAARLARAPALLPRDDLERAAPAPRARRRKPPIRVAVAAPPPRAALRARAAPLPLYVEHRSLLL